MDVDDDEDNNDDDHDKYFIHCDVKNEMEAET